MTNNYSTLDKTKVSCERTRIGTRVHRISTPKSELKKPAVSSELSVFSELESLDVPLSRKQEFTKNMTHENVKLLVKRVMAWKDREEDGLACDIILKRWDTWSDTTSRKEEKKQLLAQKTEERMSLSEARKERAQALKKEEPTLNMEISDHHVSYRVGVRFGCLAFADPKIDKYLDKLEDAILWRK